MFSTVLLLFGLTFVGGMPNNDMKQRDAFVHANQNCCKKYIEEPFHGFQDDLKECLIVSKELPSCKIDICIANKLGFASSDGTIDKKALEKRVDKDFENDPDLADVIKKKCVNGDISKYGDEDFCDLIKVRQCMEVQRILNCEDWKDEDYCSEIKASAQEIVK